MYITMSLCVFLAKPLAKTFAVNRYCNGQHTLYNVTDLQQRKTYSLLAIVWLEVSKWLKHNVCM